MFPSPPLSSPTPPTDSSISPSRPLVNPGNVQNLSNGLQPETSPHDRINQLKAGRGSLCSDMVPKNRPNGRPDEDDDDPLLLRPNPAANSPSGQLEVSSGPLTRSDRSPGPVDTPKDGPATAINSRIRTTGASRNPPSDTHNPDAQLKLPASKRASVFQAARRTGKVTASGLSTWRRRPVPSSAGACQEHVANQRSLGMGMQATPARRRKARKGEKVCVCRSHRLQLCSYIFSRPLFICLIGELMLYDITGQHRSPIDSSGSPFPPYIQTLHFNQIPGRRRITSRYHLIQLITHLVTRRSKRNILLRSSRRSHSIHWYFTSATRNLIPGRVDRGGRDIWTHCRRSTSHCRLHCSGRLFR